MSCSLCRLLQVEEYQELTSLSRATTTVVCGKPAREAITLCAQAGRAYCRKMDALTNPTCPWGFRGASFQNCMCPCSVFSPAAGFTQACGVAAAPIARLALTA